MSMLAELVEAAIGVDTHAETHTAAVLDTRTGAVLARATALADPDGYAELTALAQEHSGLRAWAMEGTGGYGAGLARHLAGVGDPKAAVRVVLSRLAAGTAPAGRRPDADGQAGLTDCGWRRPPGGARCG